MKATLFIFRGSLLEFPIEIPEGSGSLKRGKDLLVMEVVDEHSIPWYEFEPVFVVADNVEIIGKVRQLVEVKEEENGSYFYQVKVQKVSIKENPILSLAFDKNSNETKVHDPTDLPAKKMADIQEDLREAASTESLKLLNVGDEIFPEDTAGEPADVALYKNLDQFIKILRGEKDNPMAGGLLKLAFSLKNHLSKEVSMRKHLELENTQQSESLIALHLKIDKMERDLQEVIDNYIPDLSAELNSEG